MSKHLLFVDDEPITLLAFRKLFSGPDVMVDTAETLTEALRKVSERTYSVVVADLRLTGVLGEEGLEILKRVKARQASTGFILVTGYGSDSIRKKAVELGADFYLEKPVSYSTLRSALGTLGMEI